MLRTQRFVALCLLLLVFVTPLAGAVGYVSAGDVDLTRLLPPPPVPGSAADAAELNTVLEIQKTRTAAQVEHARADQRTSVLRFAGALGAELDAPRLPRNTVLFRLIALDVVAVTRPAKAHWRRPRPFVASDEVKPVLGTSRTDWSYPSGHATFGCTAAIVIANMVPERSAAVFERGRDYGQSRVIGGVHYPRDVEAGCTAGTVVAAALLRNVAFRYRLLTPKGSENIAQGRPLRAHPG